MNSVLARSKTDASCLGREAKKAAPMARRCTIGAGFAVEALGSASAMFAAASR
jgi:hypothetical protein